MKPPRLAKGGKSVKTMAEYFDEEAQRHDEHFVIQMGMSEFYDEIENQISACAVKNEILVLGCGTGLEIERIKYPARVTAVDIAPKMLEQLEKKRLYEGVTLRTVCASFLDMDFGRETFNLVLSCYALHHFNPDQKRALYRNIGACLKEGGAFLNGDVMARNWEEEEKIMQNALRIYGRERMPFGSLPVDAPITMESETGILRETGFSSIEILREWTRTTLYRAEK
jgi:SAM-dependent methyltransferase